MGTTSWSFPMILAGAGFEPSITCFANLLMVRDSWSKRLVLRQLDTQIQFSRVPRKQRESTTVLETVWRRQPIQGVDCSRIPPGCRYATIRLRLILSTGSEHSLDSSQRGRNLETH